MKPQARVNNWETTYRPPKFGQWQVILVNIGMAAHSNERRIKWGTRVKVTANY